MNCPPAFSKSLHAGLYVYPERKISGQRIAKTLSPQTKNLRNAKNKPDQA